MTKEPTQCPDCYGKLTRYAMARMNGGPHIYRYECKHCKAEKKKAKRKANSTQRRTR